MLHVWITLFALCHGNVEFKRTSFEASTMMYQCLSMVGRSHGLPLTTALLMTLPEVGGFLIHNTHYSLCLEDQAGAAELRRCNLDSGLQQWVWWNRRVLKNLGSDRCLAGGVTDLVRTMACQALTEEGGAGAEEILWDCEGGRLISVSGRLGLSVDDSLSLVLTRYSRRSGRWRSPDEGDICQESLRSKRASNEPEDFEKPAEGTDPKAEMAGMTEEQKKFLLWYYRSEDPTTWKFVLLGLSFFGLLVGFLLLGMGSMANRNRREIAKYKAAAALARQPGGDELLTLKHFADLEASPLGHSPAPSSPAGAGRSPGEIVVTWRDGDVSTLYPDPVPEEEEREKGKGEEDMEPSSDTEESRIDKSVVKDELGVCDEDEVQQQMTGKIE